MQKGSVGAEKDLQAATVTDGLIVDDTTREVAKPPAVSSDTKAAMNGSIVTGRRPSNANPQEAGGSVVQQAAGLGSPTKRSADEAASRSLLPQQNTNGAPRKKKQRRHDVILPAWKNSDTEASDEDPETDQELADHVVSSLREEDHVISSLREELHWDPLGQPAATAAFESKFQLLQEYKAVYGNVAVLAVHCPDGGRFHGLSRFLKDWRFQVNQLKRGLQKKTSMNEAKIRLMMDLGVDLEMPPIRASTSPAMNRRNLERLKEYKEVYGTAVVSRERCRQDTKFQGLYEYLNRWRRRVRRFKEGGQEKTGACEAMMRQLIHLGFLHVETPVQRLSPNELFERKYQLLREYRDMYGTLAVRAVHCREGKFHGLGRFLREWRLRVRQFQKNPEKKTIAAEAKIHMLIDLGVDL